MRLYNPTLIKIEARCGGVNYPFEPSEVRELSDSIASHILGNHLEHGMVELNVPHGMEAKDATLYVVRKTLEGLERFKQHINYILEQYISLDTEMKQQNQYGTILNHKNVKYWTKMIEDVVKCVSELETKYGMSITEEETSQRTNVLLNSIDGLVKEFEADSERKSKSIKEEQEINAMINSIVPKEIVKRSKEARA